MSVDYPYLPSLEEQIVAVLSPLEELADVFPAEPTTWKAEQMPLAWLRWLGPTIRDAETGGGQDVTHAWELELVCDAPATGKRELVYQFESAQEQLKTVTQAVTRAFRGPVGATLNGTVDETSLRLLREAEFFLRPPSKALMYGLAFRLTATLTEYDE